MILTQAAREVPSNDLHFFNCMKVIFYILHRELSWRKGIMPTGEIMEIQIHRDFNEINETEWNTLLQRNSTNVPFLDYGYLKRWWEFKGGGEWQDGELAIISGRRDGKLAGIAPFFIATHEGIQKILFLGSIEISDYLDLIVEPDYAEEFIEGLFDLLAGQFSSIKEILLYNLPQASPSIPLLEKYAQKHAWKSIAEKAYHTPIIQLAGDWDAYLSGIDKKQRHEIRRKLRRAEESSESVQWYVVKDAEKLDSEIDGFFDLMVLDDEKKNFLTPLMREQMRSLIHWAFERSLLQLSFFTVEGKKAAAYLCLDYRERIWVYNSGFDPQFREYSPGWVLLAYLIQQAIQSGKHSFDFMRGDEDYKYRFGAADDFVMKLQFTK